MIDVRELLRLSVEKNASDIFITVGVAPTLKIEGTLYPLDYPPLNPDETEKIVMELFKREETYNEYLEDGENDFSLSLQGVGRFRIGVYSQRGSMSAVIRVLGFDKNDKLLVHKPQVILDLHKETKGLILITGPSGSGKSTTISQIVDLINQNRSCHIITLEDPIEYLHKHDKSIVDQRELGLDTKSYSKGLRAAMRQAPDVIQVGEMRDPETIEESLTVAETGHLVISSLHTLGAAKTLDRIIDVFPSNKQQQIRYQLSTELVAIVSQQLIPSHKYGRVPAFEIMLPTPEIRKLIREERLQEIEMILKESDQDGLLGMDVSIAKLLHEGKIEEENAIKYSIDKEVIMKYISELK
ncbi:MAG: PilT/PilU family type 4a pilus ATPase [Gudongella sp.]|nr:PilT/PilU family type 4a pilus ATPase [Gudongella sp.]